MSEACHLCNGERWVCESHPDKAWPNACRCSPGMPCACNPDALLGPGVEVIVATPRWKKREQEGWS